MTPSLHSHHKSSDTTTDEKIQENGNGTMSLPKAVKVPSIWIARSIYTVILAFLAHLSWQISNLAIAIETNHQDLNRLSLVVHDLPTRDYVEKVTDSLNARLQVLELWETKLQGSNILIAQDKYAIDKEIADIRLAMTQSDNELAKKMEKLPADFPPTWFKDQVDEKFRTIEDRLKNIENILLKKSQTTEDFGINKNTQS